MRRMGNGAPGAFTPGMSSGSGAFLTRAKPAVVWVLWALLLCLATGLGLYTAYWQDRFLTAESAEHRIIQLTGTLERLDEVLTLSASMAAATGDPRWEQRYRRLEPQQERTLGEAAQWAGKWGAGTEVAGFRANAAELASLENQALERVRNGERAAAAELLESPAYRQLDERYREELQVLSESVRARLESTRNQSARNRSRTLAGAVLLACLGIFFLVLSLLLRRQDREQNRARQEIRRQYEFMNLVLESLSHPFYVIDASDHTVKLSNKAGRLLEAGPGPVTCHRLSHGRDAPCQGGEHPCPLAVIRETGKPVRVEHTHRTPEGESRDVEVHGYPLFDEHGRVAQVIEYSLDVTESKQAHRQLEEREAHLKAIQENIETGIVVVDAETHRILDANPAAERMIGAPRERILGRLCHESICRATEGKCPAADLGETLRNREAELVTADGGSLAILKTVVPVTLAGRRCLLDTFVDISDRKKMLETLRESEQRFRSIAASAQDAIIMMDPEGRVSYWNEAAEGIFWWSSQEVMGQPLHPLLAPDKYFGAYERGRDRFRETGGGGAVGRTLELTALRKDGQEFPIEISLAGVKIQEQWHAIGIIRDITDRKRSEEALRTAKEAAEQSTQALNRYALEMEQKNIALEYASRQAEEAHRAKSEFLANMSHEIRTPMNGVIGMTGLLLETTLTPEQRECAETVRKSGEVLLELINDILDFSKSEAGKLEFEEIPFDLRVCLEELGEMLAQRAHEKGLELAVLIRYDVPTRVKGDPGRLRQVLLNLINNAIKFTEEGEVLMRVSLAGLDAQQESVLFEIVDTGIGIPDDRVERLFQPFAQGDPSMTRRYGGTGLGLAIARQIVEAMGGRIQVKSQEGRGSTFSFTVTFSRQHDAASAPALAGPEEIRGLRVLIVDDHEVNRAVFREQFKAWQCRTGEAADGPAALQILREASGGPDPFRLALVDYQMPDMNGEQLARAIRSEPGLAALPLVLVTSVPRRGDAARMLEAGFDAYLVKPVKQAKLHEAVAAVLGIRQGAREAGARDLVTQHTLKEAVGARWRVLVVEDNIVNQRVATRMLEKRGCRCDVAANGLEAVEALARLTYDLVFMDCQMPDMDGYQATREIRRREDGGRRTPIIAMTAHAMQGDRERCLAAGMDDYISKPVSAPGLYALLEKHLERRAPRAGEPPAARGAGHACPVEFGSLQEASDGDAVFERELILQFIVDTEQRILTLDAARGEHDAPALRREAHSVKGASSVLGARALSAIAHRIEQLAAQDDLDRAEELLPSLRSEFGRVRDALEAYLAAPGASREPGAGEARPGAAVS